MRILHIVTTGAVAALLLAACSDGGGSAVPTSPSSPTASHTPTLPPSSTRSPTVVASRTPTPVSPGPSYGIAQVVRKGNTLRNMVAFSFDAGSDAGYTSQIVDVLAANGIKSSVSLTGRWVEQNPDLLRRIVSEGHELVNHSYDHSSFTGQSSGEPPLSGADRREQLDRTEEIVLEIAGASTKPYFRPPYGDYDHSVNVDAGASGYAYNVMWTVDSGGWMGLPAGEITRRCLNLAEPGAIYVFHVGSASQDGLALQGIIDGLRAAGFTIGSLSDVLAP